MKRAVKKEEKLYRIGMIIGGIVLFVMVLYFSLHLDTNEAPDEEMRMMVVKFIYEHHRLPLGSEAEIRHEVWGFSYGYTPYLPCLLGAFNMRIVSLFTTSETALWNAARFENVCAILMMWFLVGKIGRRVMKNRSSALLLAVMVCFLPQIVFIASYLNNDMISLMCTSWIALGWLRGDQDGWNAKNAVFLGIGIGILALTYYNDYAWILCSIIFFFASAAKQKLEGKKILQYALIVFFTAFMIAGWFFIRNYIIHDGDFLGMNTMYAQGEKYAQDPYKPTKRATPLHQGLSFYDTYIASDWFGLSWKSFIAVFGYMNIMMKQWFYVLYTVMYVVLIGLTVMEMIRRKDVPARWNICLLICMAVPVVLSMYYSYSIDYQAQGRYIISMALPLMFFCTYGTDSIVFRIKKKGVRAGSVFNLFLTAFWLVLSFYSLFSTFVPNSMI